MKVVSVVVVMLALVVLMPQASASFSEPPTFDLQTSSDLAGATDAAYLDKVQDMEAHPSSS